MPLVAEVREPQGIARLDRLETPVPGLFQAKIGLVTEKIRASLSQGPYFVNSSILPSKVLNDFTLNTIPAKKPPSVSVAIVAGSSTS